MLWVLTEMNAMALLLWDLETKNIGVPSLLKRETKKLRGYVCFLSNTIKL